MTVSALAAVKRMAAHSGWSLSNLELQKLLYIAHMFHLGRTGGEPLVTGHFEAWDYGPVHPAVYRHLRVFGSAPVEDIFHSVQGLGNSDEAKLLEQAVDQLAHLGPGKLVAITHRKNGAWENNYRPGVRGILMPNEDILAEYRLRESEAESGR